MKRSFIKPITLFGDDQPIEKVSDLLSIKASSFTSNKLEEVVRLF